MRALTKILLGAFALFMAFSIIQQWDFFSSAWFGGGEKGPEMTDADRKAAGEAVGLYLRLVSHLYGTGGDPRFAERIPATPPIVEEQLADIAFLRHRHRLQEPRLMGLEIRSVEPAGEGRAEVTVREFWVTRLLWMDGSGEAEPRRSDILNCRYRLYKEGTAWRIWSWEPLDGEGAEDIPPVPPGGGGASP